MKTGFQVHIEYADTSEVYRIVERHGVALAMQDAAMEDPKVVRCEIKDRVTGLIQGRAKPVRVK